jgi:hypothetical protein
MMGFCKLCLQNRKLAKSHFSPAAVYKAFDRPGLPNRNPVWVMPDVVVQTSRQITDYAFCHDCEHVFNVGGEKWFLPLLAKDVNTVPFFDLVNAGPPEFVEGIKKVFAASRNPAIRVEELSHFALGL